MRQKQRGSTILEFALASTFLLLPLLFGTGTVGMSLIRAIHIVELNRDAGQMFSRGMDFSQTVNRNMLLRVAAGLDITDSGGSGVIVLSQIECTGSTTAVVTHRLVIGNAALRASSFASPTLVDSSGMVNYTGDPTGSNASSFLAAMAMSAGDTAYVAETYFKTPNYDWPGFLTGTGTYTRSIF